MSEVIARAAIAVLVAIAAPVHADVSADDAKKATVLFDEGTKLSDAGKHDQACEKFEASLVLDPQLGALLNVAVCREKAGKLAEAYRLLERGAAEAARTGKTGRETYAKGQLAKLAAKVVRFTISGVDASIPGLEIRVGGTPIPSAELAAQQIASPGPIEVEATAPGHAPAKVAHAGKPGEVVVLALPPLIKQAGATPVPGEQPPPTRDLPINNKPNRTPALISISAGTGLLLSAVLVGYHAKTRYDDAVEINDRDGVSSAQTQGNVGTVIGAVGLVAIGVGTYLYIRAGKSRVVVAPTAKDGAGVTLVGRF